MKTYLSGGMEYAEKFGSEWRKEIESWIKQNLGHEVFNPATESRQFFKIKFPDIKRETLKQESEEIIRNVIGDLVKFECNELITNCDYVICLWDESCKKGAGTQGELTLAKYYNRPVYIVTSFNLEEISAWIVGCSTKIFSNIDSLKEYLLSVYNTNK